MRLIDADKLMLSLADWELQEAPIHTYEKPKEFTADNMQEMIWRTIRDCESAVEEQPTVKAIPIEWIKNIINANIYLWEQNKERMFIDQGLMQVANYSITAQVLTELIERWEKENENN